MRRKIKGLFRRLRLRRKSDGYKEEKDPSQSAEHGLTRYSDTILGWGENVLERRKKENAHGRRNI